MPKRDPGRQIIILSAATRDRRQELASFARSLSSEVDWDLLGQTLQARNLLNLLGPRLLELGGDRASEGFATKVEQGIDAGRRYGVFLQLTATRVMTMLIEAGIGCAPLKGPQMSEALHGDAGRRLSGDIDILVAPENLERAVAVVRELGYSPPGDYVRSNGLPRLHFALVHPHGELPPVELHWRIHWYEQDFARLRLLPPAAEESLQWRPRPVDELAALLLFYARDGFVDLRLATDLSAWWDVRGEQVTTAELDRSLATFPALARACQAALAAAERVVGLPAARLSDKANSLDLRQRTAVRLANPNPRQSPPQIYADRGLIDGLLAPPGEVRGFVRRQLLPPREVLVQQAEHAQREKVHSSLGRLSGVLGRYGLTMARLLRSPETLPVGPR